MNKLTTSLENLREAPPRIPTGEVEENREVVNLFVESKPYTKVPRRIEERGRSSKKLSSCQS